MGVDTLRVNGALVICTKDRYSIVIQHVERLQRQKCPLKEIVIVDSSAEESAQALGEWCANLTQELRVTHITSKPGLPHQRNIGVSHLLKRNFKRLEFISFLDDDIIVEDNYFFEVERLFSQYDQVIAIGGYDASRSLQLPKRCYVVFGLSSYENGVVLSSGLTTTPRPVQILENCQWIPGGMQNIRTRILRNYRFDGRTRMYGEDVDFYLQVANEGIIACSSNLPVRHLNSVIGKDDYREIQSFSDGFRWTLTKKYRKEVKKKAVLFSTVCLTIGELSRWIFLNDTNGRSGFHGHLDFWVRLIRRRQLLQLVEHDDWK